MNQRHQSALRFPPSVRGKSAPPCVCLGPMPLASGRQRVGSIARKVRCALHFCIEGASRLPLAVRVGNALGNDKDSGASVRGADIACRKRDRKARIAEPFQAAAYSVHPERGAACHVFDHDPLGHELGGNALELVPKAAPSTRKASSRASTADVLTRKASAEEPHGRQVCASDVFDLFITRHTWPVLREHRTRVGVALDLPSHRPKARSFEPEIKTPNTREERADWNHLTTSKICPARLHTTTPCARSFAIESKSTVQNAKGSNFTRAAVLTILAL